MRKCLLLTSCGMYLTHLQTLVGEVDLALEQTFGKSSESTFEQSQSSTVDTSCRSPLQTTSPDVTTDTVGTSATEVAYPRSSLSRRVYPSSTSTEPKSKMIDRLGLGSNEVARSSAEHPTRSSSRLGHALPHASRSQADSVLNGLMGQDANPGLSDRSRLVSEAMVTSPRPRTPQRMMSGPASTQSLRTDSALRSSRRVGMSHDENLKKSISRPLNKEPRHPSHTGPSGPLRALDTNRTKLNVSQRPVSILSSSSCLEQFSGESSLKALDGTARLTSQVSRSSSGSGSGSGRRVRIMEDPSTVRRASLRSLSHHHQRSESGTDENLRSVEEEEEEMMGVGSAPKKPGVVVGYGVEPGAAESTSGSDWVVVKSDSNRLGEGEPNLRRWSLRASALLSAHPKIINAEESENW